MLVLIFVVSVLPQIQANIYNVSNTTDLSKCKIHYTRSEGSYKDFFEIADESRNNDTLLDFHFSVLAPSDAHILLSPSSKLKKLDPAYEIVLGAGGNVFSDIRRAQKSAVKASIRRKNILSALDVQSFWIHISKEGLIEVGREGEELAFLSWKDADPLPLKYFSFGTWPGVEAKWFFDCPREDNTTTNSKEVPKQLTNLQILRHDLLSFYDPYVRPVYNSNDVTVVRMQLLLNYISLNEYQSTLHVKGTMKLAWMDEKLKWNVSDYGNIKSLHLVGRQIWQPDLLLYNSADYSDRDVLGQSVMIVTSSGYVEWTPPLRIKAWCDASDLGHWPSDTHSCDIILGFSKDFNYLQLQFNNMDSKILGQQFQTEWNILKVQAITNYGWNLTSENYSLNKYNLPFFKLNFKLKRSSNVYNAIFFTPFIIVASAMLLTFWVSPLGNLKISLGCLQLTITSLVLVNLANFIPAHPIKVPYLVLLHSFSCLASVVGVFLSIVVINLSRTQYKKPVPHGIWRFLTSYPVQAMLLLSNVQISENYGKLEDTYSVKSDESIQSTWMLLGKAIDRIGFIIFFILIICSVTIKY